MENSSALNTHPIHSLPLDQIFLDLKTHVSTIINFYKMAGYDFKTCNDPKKEVLKLFGTIPQDLKTNLQFGDITILFERLKDVLVAAYGAEGPSRNIALEGFRTNLSNDKLFQEILGLFSIPIDENYLLVSRNNAHAVGTPLSLTLTFSNSSRLDEVRERLVAVYDNNVEISKPTGKKQVSQPKLTFTFAALGDRQYTLDNRAEFVTEILSYLLAPNIAA